MTNIFGLKFSARSKFFNQLTHYLGQSCEMLPSGPSGQIFLPSYGYFLAIFNFQYRIIKALLIEITFEGMNGNDTFWFNNVGHFF